MQAPVRFNAMTNIGNWISDSPLYVCTATNSCATEYKPNGTQMPMTHIMKLSVRGSLSIRSTKLPLLGSKFCSAIRGTSSRATGLNGRVATVAKTIVTAIHARVEIWCPNRIDDKLTETSCRVVVIRVNTFGGEAKGTHSQRGRMKPLSHRAHPSQRPPNKAAKPSSHPANQPICVTSHIDESNLCPFACTMSHRLSLSLRCSCVCLLFASLFQTWCIKVTTPGKAHLPRTPLCYFCGPRGYIYIYTYIYIYI